VSVVTDTQSSSCKHLLLTWHFDPQEMRPDNPSDSTAVQQTTSAVLIGVIMIALPRYRHD
jgi:hypothetical protein